MNSWKEGGEVNTPWLHPSVLPIVRDWICFRYRLMPYLYTLYWRGAEFSEPMLRPLFYEFPDDARAFEDSDDFMLGPNLLVASMFGAQRTAESVYLPGGPPGGSTSDRRAPSPVRSRLRRHARRHPLCPSPLAHYSHD
jgi:alpha-glucosidase